MDGGFRYLTDRKFLLTAGADAAPRAHLRFTMRPARPVIRLLAAPLLLRGGAYRLASGHVVALTFLFIRRYESRGHSL